MRALLRTDRADDELAALLARAGLYVERVEDAGAAEARLASPDVALVDPRLLGAPRAPAPAPASAEPGASRPLAERSFEELCYERLGAFLDRLGDQRLPALHATVIGEVERALLRLAMERGGSLGAAAALLDVHRNTLSRRLEELGLRRAAARTKRGRGGRARHRRAG